MSKIIRQNGFEEVCCAFCGCVYEYEKGDKIETITFERLENGTPIVFQAVLECPICGAKNPIKVKQ